MKRRIILCSLLAASALVILLSVVPARAHVLSRPQATQPEQVEPPISDLFDLLNDPYKTQIQDLAGPDKEHVLSTLLTRPEAIQLRRAMAEKGFFANQSAAQAMRVTVQGVTQTLTIDVAVAPMVAGRRIFLPLVLRNYAGSHASLASVERSDETLPPPSPEGLSAYLVAMVASNGTSFFQAHHTNLDPRLAEVPDLAIVVNGMPYFYITTLQVVHGRIVYWHYWWYDSDNHPNWYYAYYRYYWSYYYHAGFGWPWWYHWGYGWTYWRFWYYWSTWFPWLAPPLP
jgi:hypothetical protein